MIIVIRHIKIMCAATKQQGILLRSTILLSLNLVSSEWFLLIKFLLFEFTLSYLLLFLE